MKKTARKKRKTDKPVARDKRTRRQLVEDMAYGIGLRDSALIMRQLLETVLSPKHITLTVRSTIDIDSARLNMAALEKARAFIEVALEQLDKATAENIAESDSAVEELVRRGVGANEA